MENYYGLKECLMSDRNSHTHHITEMATRACTLKFYLILVLLLPESDIMLFGQASVLVSEIHPELRYYPLKGMVYYQDYLQIKGTAFLHGENWVTGDLILASGRNISDVKFRIDIYSHRILVYQEYLKRIIVVSKKDISEISITDVNPPRKFVFLKGIPSRAKVSDGCYFEALSEGKLSFYKLYYKDVLPLRTPEMPLLDEFVDRVSYFLIDGETINNVRLQKKVLTRMYPKYKPGLKQFIRKKDLHLRREADFITAVSYLSSVLELIESNSQSIPEDAP